MIAAYYAAVADRATMLATALFAASAPSAALALMETLKQVTAERDALKAKYEPPEEPPGA